MALGSTFPKAKRVASGATRHGRRHSGERQPARFSEGVLPGSQSGKTLHVARECAPGVTRCRGTHVLAMRTKERIGGVLLRDRGGKRGLAACTQRLRLSLEFPCGRVAGLDRECEAQVG